MAGMYKYGRYDYDDYRNVAQQLSIEVPNTILEATKLGFDKLVIGEPFDINKINRNVPIFKAAIASKTDNTYIYLIWDRLDEALYFRVVKQSGNLNPKGELSADIKTRFSSRNELEVLDHRIYPSFIDGYSTVAAQREALKEGYSKSELPDTASISSFEVISLEESKVTFDQKVFGASIENDNLFFDNREENESLHSQILLLSLPEGYILGLTLSQIGNGFIDGEIYSVTGGNGQSAEVLVSATPTVVSSIEILNGGDGFFNQPGTIFNTSGGDQYGQNFYGEGTGLQIRVDGLDERGTITDVSIESSGTRYTAGDVVSITNDTGSIAYFTVDVTGGEVTSVSIPEFGGLVKSILDDYGLPDSLTEYKNGNILSGGAGYEVSDVITILGGDGGASVEVTQIVTSQTYDPNAEFTFELGAQSLYIDVHSFDGKRSDVLTLQHTTTPLQYETTYKVIIGDVLNLAKQSLYLEAFVTTDTAPVACNQITSILFEAYGSGSQSLAPMTEAAYNIGHTNNDFIYFQSGEDWSTFQERFEGDIPIEVPESVTPPDKVYVWYKEGTRLLGDSAWIVGIIGDELDYNQDYTYVIYTLESVLNYYQLTPVGTSTYVCGTSEWGGDWGGSIQQFAIYRDAV